MAQRSGLTLIEVMIIVAVLGVITAIALPRFPILSAKTVETEARRIQSDLRLTRRLAITHGNDYILEISPLSNEYNIYNGSVAPANQVGETRTIKPSITASGDSTFTFESLGNAAAGSGTTLTLTSGSDAYDITITIATGRVSIAPAP
ncbi:MAG: GspH/FimT family pseudopilin [bacterium]|nr:GspH/FimT family pseudopilin [Candidatus Margulisiibacteriota bacterium]